VEWKKTLLFAVVPALIAGLFAIGPKLYDIIAEPRAELTYSLVSGPELPVGGGVQRIVSVTIRNSGKKSLTSVDAVLSIENGKIEAHKVQDTGGPRASLRVTATELSLQVFKLHPGEQIPLSAMIVLPGASSTPRLTLRSEEVLGKPEVPKPENRQDFLSLLGAVLTGGSVFLMALIAMGRKGPMARILDDYKDDILFYIPARLQLNTVRDHLRSKVPGITYLRIADTLLAYGLAGTPEERAKAAQGLKCLLLIKGVAETSVSVIIQDLRLLAADSFSQAEVTALLTPV
jgi:hypothetical protein